MAVSKARLARIREVVRKRLPKNVVLHEGGNQKTSDGFARPKPHLYMHGKIDDEYALYVFLHEVGHIVCKHLQHDTEELPNWLTEYEAEQWAIKAMRAEGFRVTRKTLEHAKNNVRLAIEAEKVEPNVDKHIRRWAYS